MVTQPTLEQSSKRSILPGKYRHYKGGEYQVIDTVIHSETEEIMVLYKPLYGEQALWVRPIDMFFETVIFNGRSVNRFELVQVD